MPEIDLGLEVAVLIDDSGMVVVTTTIVQLVLGLIGYIYIYIVPPQRSTIFACFTVVDAHPSIY